MEVAIASMSISPASPSDGPLAIGAPAPVFRGLLDVGGERIGSAELADRDVVVLIFSSNRCPTAKAYAGRLNALQRTYGPRGVQLVAINANDPHLYPDEGYPRMIERAAEDGYAFPYLVDDGQRLARAFGARCTFHAFVLDRQRRLRYQGRVDDARIESRATTRDLADALDDILADRPVRNPVTRPFGCALDLV